MQNLETLFVRELRDSVVVNGAKDIYKIPLPQECAGWNVSGCQMYAVRGCEEEDFKQLEGFLVKALPRGVVAKQRVIDPSTRKFKVEDGKYAYKNYPIQSGSIAVISKRKLVLPYKWWQGTENGFGYIDYKMSKSGMEYLYVLPKSILYRVHQTALVLSVKNMKNFAGMGYTTWNNGKIFLHVVPYNPNASYVGSRVLATGCTLDYSEKITKIVDFWQVVGLVPEIRLCQLMDGTNLCLSETIVGYDDYQRLDDLPLNEKEVYGEEYNND